MNRILALLLPLLLGGVGETSLLAQSFSAQWKIEPPSIRFGDPVQLVVEYTVAPDWQPEALTARELLPQTFEEIERVEPNPVAGVSGRIRFAARIWSADPCVVPARDWRATRRSTGESATVSLPELRIPVQSTLAPDANLTPELRRAWIPIPQDRLPWLLIPPLLLAAFLLAWFFWRRHRALSTTPSPRAVALARLAALEALPRDSTQDPRDLCAELLSLCRILGPSSQPDRDAPDPAWAQVLDSLETAVYSPVAPTPDEFRSLLSVASRLVRVPPGIPMNSVSG